MEVKPHVGKSQFFKVHTPLYSGRMNQRVYLVCNHIYGDRCMATTYLVKEISTITGSSPATVRSWCGTFAEFLSPTATPAGGQQRVFTEKDLAIFQRIADLRSSEKLGNDQIKERLRKEGIDTLTPYIDLAIAPPISPQQPVTAPASHQEGPQQPVTAIDLYTGIIGHLSSLQTHIDGLQQRIDSQEKDRTGRVTLFAVGVLVGLLVAAILIGAVWLMK